jgi:hypothetical protein
MTKFKLGLLCIAMLLAANVTAQEKEDAQAPESIQKLKLASELVVYGYKNSLALPLIQAADLYLSTDMMDLETEKTKEGEGDKSSKEGKVSFDVKKILDDAKAFTATEDEEDAYLKLIAALEKKVGTRSPVGGTKRTYETVLANSTDSYAVSLRAQERTYIEVYGDGDTDLDLYVYDENGNLIVKDESSSYNAAVYLVPKWTGRFYVKVKNCGRVYNDYMIVMY